MSCQHKGNGKGLTMELHEALAAVRDYDPYTLASLADVMSPDGTMSPGADYLKSVRDSVIDQIEGSEELHDEYDWFEGLDSTVPVYTHNVWQTFVDLGAYQDEYAEEAQDLTTKSAQMVLFYIAERLADALLGDIRSLIAA